MSSLLESLQNCSEEELEQVENQITEYEGKLAQLKSVRKILKARFHSSPERKKKGPPTLSDKIVEYIDEHGPSNVGDVALALQSTVAGVGMAVRRSPAKLKRVGDVLDVRETEDT